MSTRKKGQDSTPPISQWPAISKTSPPVHSPSTHAECAALDLPIPDERMPPFWTGRPIWKLVSPKASDGGGGRDDGSSDGNWASGTSFPETLAEERRQHHALLAEMTRRTICWLFPEDSMAYEASAAGLLHRCGSDAE